MTIAVTPEASREDSLKKRYTYKLGASFLALPFTLGTQAFVTRLLGPILYGNYSFLNTFFTQIVGFFDAGISAGFYSKLSQRPEESGLVRFFWGVTAVVSTLVIASVALVLVAGLGGEVWPDQQSRYVWMAAAWGLLTWYSQVINKALDAYGLTVDGEIARFQQKVLSLALILPMYWLRRASLTQFYLYQYAILGFLCVSWAVVLRRHGRKLFPSVRLTIGQVAGYSREFYTYAAPLVVLGLVALIADVLDRWFLQKFSGSTQQGFFGLSYQVGALCFFASNAMTPLFWREISKSFGAQDREGMRLRFGRTVKVMFMITAFLSTFVALQAKNVSLALGGFEFSQATLPVSIMVFYPVHQTYGQLTGSFLLGTGQTQLVRNIGVAVMPLGLVLTLWLLAPASKGGLELGATGLAMKMVVAQFVSVNLQLWFVVRFLGTSFRAFFKHQLYSLAALFIVGFTSTRIVESALHDPLLACLCSGALYCGGVAALLFFFPSWVDLSRAQLRVHLAVARKALSVW